MADAIGKIGLVFLGGLLAGMGYLLKRWIEKKPVVDAIERYQKLLSLTKELTEQKISLDDLEKLQTSLLKKSVAAENYAQSLKSEAKNLVEEKGKEFRTQAEMNQQAVDSFRLADAKLKVALATLESLLSYKERDALREAQATWENYRSKQGEYAAKQYEGGSIAPLIFYSELESVTLARIAAIESEVEHSRSLPS